MSRRQLGWLLMAGGIVAFLVGELSGVFSAGEFDTLTELVTWLSVKSYGLFLVPVLAGLGWAAYHFIDHYRTHRP